MAKFPCIGCKKDFRNQRGLQTHKRFCKKVMEETARLLQLRIDSENASKADKTRLRSEGSESIHDDGVDGPSYQPTVEEEMTVDEVRLLKFLKSCPEDQSYPHRAIQLLPRQCCARQVAQIARYAYL